ncbi:MAG: bifunctional phosphoribosylaminoimidazolecarboxamide formyltransferase/IMP cyclohydrolase, partial [Bryobacteraceae bacterium]|nr:bifunctional phosphoribosylaminoimidazolecarboxamide formyltransferase/IMP cyclohydrolase [Bryobacteraceae bacterium]
MDTIKRALLSVTDKTGVAEFAANLHRMGVEIVSTGGTAAAIRGAGVPVRDVAELTGFPEMLDGRVKTLHPRVAAGVLAIRSDASHMRSLGEHGIGTIDMVVVNLYAFDKVAARANAGVHELVENIDIGGPTMIRAAAKNWHDVAVITSPGDYEDVLEEMRRSENRLSRSSCWTFAKKAFALTASYDVAISARLASISIEEDEFQDRRVELPEVLILRAPRVLDLRYGENPHQKAALYSLSSGGIATARQLHGKELSYNNLVDLDAAWQLVAEFDSPAAAVIKHTNPCGCAEQLSLAEAYRKAFEADPVSAFGGVLAFNRLIDEETADEIAKTFIEAIAAPGYTDAALAILTAKKNLRLLVATAA